MVCLRKIFLVAAVPLLFVLAAPSFASDEDEENSSHQPPPPPPDTPEPMDENDDEGGASPEMGGDASGYRGGKGAAIPKPKEQKEEDPALYKDAPPTELSVKEKQAICHKYKGRYIGYYDEVYEVKSDCKRRELDRTEINNLGKKNLKVLAVEGDVIAALPLRSEIKSAKLRPCSTFHGKYVALETDPGTFYWIENCQRRLFPDYETFIEHHTKRRDIFQSPIHVTEGEFAKFKEGPSMPSVIDKELSQRGHVKKSKEDIPFLPEEQVCPGLIGKTVSYLDKVYRIIKAAKGKGCLKEEMNAEKFSRQYGNKRLQELSSAEFIAIPSPSPRTTPSEAKGESRGLPRP